MKKKRRARKLVEVRAGFDQGQVWMDLAPARTPDQKPPRRRRVYWLRPQEAIDFGELLQEVGRKAVEEEDFVAPPTSDQVH